MVMVNCLLGETYVKGGPLGRAVKLARYNTGQVDMLLMITLLRS